MVIWRKPQYTQITQYPQFPYKDKKCEQMGYYGVLWVTIGYYENYLNS